MEKIEEHETKQEMYLKIPKGGVGAEIGVCKGLNAMHLWQILKPSKMYLCDIWLACMTKKRTNDNTDVWEGNHQDLVESFFQEEIDSGKVVTSREYGGNFLFELEDSGLDWIYLDANHKYDAVSIELELAVRKVKKGGFIMGHDYMTNTLVWKTGVIRAVNERIQNGDMKMEAITMERFPSFLCRVL